MTYLELYEQANYELEHSLITLGEYEKRIKPLEEEVRQTGNWIRLIEDYPNCDFEFKGCSVCRTHYPNLTVRQFRYCPNCGSKMEGE